MASELFVDTSGFYAALVKGDDAHHRAVEILGQARQGRQRFVTTDYVLDETATLLRARGLGRLVEPVFSLVFDSAVCEVGWTDSETFSATRRYFQQHSDKSWSFTDCLSFVVMGRRHLRDALTKDHHFRQAGFQPLLA
ncbi:MAG: type II toxin-antitoxin system VapC family toxin [Candidatus Eremiobacteraeota bacterium]|nr:type II toxin-antitoxin system VapC family toxin [Candidatus Eremiobacteraeota bacterium]